MRTILHTHRLLAIVMVKTTESRSTQQSSRHAFVTTTKLERVPLATAVHSPMACTNSEVATMFVAGRRSQQQVALRRHLQGESFQASRRLQAIMSSRAVHRRHFTRDLNHREVLEMDLMARRSRKVYLSSRFYSRSFLDRPFAQLRRQWAKCSRRVGFGMNPIRQRSRMSRVTHNSRFLAQFHKCELRC